MRGLGWIPAAPQGWERLSSALQSCSHRCSETGGPREVNFGRVPASFRGAGVPCSCIRGPTHNRICSAYRTPAGRDNPAAPPVSCWSSTGQPSQSSSQQGLPLQPWGPAPGRRFLNSWAWNRGGTRSSGARECRACRLASCMLSPALPRPPRWGAAWLTPQVMAAESCSKLNRVSGPATGQGGVGSGGQTQGRACLPDQTQRIRVRSWLLAAVRTRFSQLWMEFCSLQTRGALTSFNGSPRPHTLSVQPVPYHPFFSSQTPLAM